MPGSNASSQNTKPARKVTAAIAAIVAVDTGAGASVGASSEAPGSSAATAAARRAGDAPPPPPGRERPPPGDDAPDQAQHRDRGEQVQRQRQRPGDHRPAGEAERAEGEAEGDRERADLAHGRGGGTHGTSIRSKPQFSYLNLSGRTAGLRWRRTPAATRAP